MGLLRVPVAALGDLTIEVLDMFYGIGYTDGKYKSGSKQYSVWYDMLRRCYDLNQRDNPRFSGYTGCAVSDNFRSGTIFGDWASEQVGFGKKDFCLDKDILIPGNKIYSEESCCFVPREINMVLTLREAARGDFPLGIVATGFSKRKNEVFYEVRVRKGALGVIEKRFYTIEDSINFYESEKLDYIKYLADKWETSISEKVFNKLKTFSF